MSIIFETVQRMLHRERKQMLFVSGFNFFLSQQSTEEAINSSQTQEPSGEFFMFLPRK